MSHFPEWLSKKKVPLGASLKVERILNKFGLHTVCQNARCPNLLECYGAGTATFLIMGNICTRACRFCAVKHRPPYPLDQSEPARLSRAVKELGLRYVVITSVTRDDLPDGGARHFYQTIRSVREISYEIIIEVLVPDFNGNPSSIKLIIDAQPGVFAHNLETVPRLYPVLRPQADYQRSLGVLRIAKQYRAAMITKSGLILGLDEESDEVLEVLKDLRSVGCDMVTLGQYLRPSLDPRHLEVKRFITPSEFENYKSKALALGFKSVASAPYVRSSYRADEYFRSLGFSSTRSATFEAASSS